MPYWIGMLGLFIGLFSPAAGVLFLIPASGKSFMENTRETYRFFIGWFIVCAFLYLINFIDKIQTLNLIAGAGLSCLFLFHLLKRNLGLNQVFMLLLLLNTLFIAFRQFLFFDIIVLQYNQAVEEAVRVVSSRFTENSEQYLIFMEMIEISRMFYMQYSPGIWISTMMLCLMLGYFFLSRKREDMSSIKFYQTHVYVIYSLVVALLIAIFVQQYRVFAINYLVALVPLFLIQGLCVLHAKIGSWLAQSKVLIAVSVLMLILNPYIVLFVSVIGLFDNWFDFRNLSKSEDLNEGHTN